MTSEAAALTEQEREQLGGPDGPWIKDDWDGLLAVIESIISARLARLADSRPVVSEAAIEAAVEVLRHLYGDHAVMPHYEARQIFTAALPHMVGDGKGEAESCDVCGLTTGHTCGGQPA